MALLMRPAHAARLLVLAAIVAALGCEGKAVNQATVYKPVTGIVQMTVTIPPGESIARVQFQVNDKVVADDSDPTDGFSTEVDTSTLPPDTLAKLSAVGVRANGTNVTLRENFVLVAEQEGNEDLEAATPAPAKSVKATAKSPTPKPSDEQDEEPTAKPASPSPSPSASASA